MERLATLCAHCDVGYFIMQKSKDGKITAKCDNPLCSSNKEDLIDFLHEVARVLEKDPEGEWSPERLELAEKIKHFIGDDAEETNTTKEETYVVEVEPNVE